MPGLSNVSTRITRRLQVGLEAADALGTEVDATRALTGQSFSYTREDEKEDYEDEMGHGTLATSARTPTNLRRGSMISWDSKLDFGQVMVPLILGIGEPKSVAKELSLLSGMLTYDNATTPTAVGDFIIDTTTNNRVDIHLPTGAPPRSQLIKAINGAGQPTEMRLVTAEGNGAKLTVTASNTPAGAGGTDILRIGGVTAFASIGDGLTNDETGYSLVVVTTNQKSWVFAPPPNERPTLRTATMEYIDVAGDDTEIKQVFSQVFNHVYCPSFNLSWGINDVADMSADFMGRAAAWKLPTSRENSKLFTNLTGVSGLYSEIRLASTFTGLDSAKPLGPVAYNATVDYTSHWAGQYWLINRRQLDFENIVAKQRNMTFNIGLGVDPSDQGAIRTELNAKDENAYRYMSLKLIGDEKNSITFKMTGVHTTDSMQGFGQDGDNEISTTTMNLSSRFDRGGGEGATDMVVEVENEYSTLNAIFNASD